MKAWIWLGLFLLAGCARDGRPDLGRVQMVEPENAVPGVGQLILRGDAGLFGRTGRATAAIIDAHHVVTAAHNLVHPELGALKSVELEYGDERFLIGRPSSKGLPGVVSSLYRTRAATGSHQMSDEALVRHDFAFLKTGPRMTKAGLFRLGQGMVPGVQVGDEVQVAGFPGGKTIRKASGRVTEVDGNLFGYDVRTGRGLSGAPVWIERGGAKFLVGIHVGSDVAGIEGAVARRVDDELIREFRRWVFSGE